MQLPTTTCLHKNNFHKQLSVVIYIHFNKCKLSPFNPTYFENRCALKGRVIAIPEVARFSRHLIYAMFSKNSRCAHGSQVSIPQLIYLAFKIALTQKKNNYIKEQRDLLLLNNVINSIINAKKSMKQHLSFDQTVSHVAKEFPPDQTAFT